jgi:hypothetical protein
MGSIHNSFDAGGMTVAMAAAYITIPFWLAFLITLICPGLWLWRRMWRGHSIPGHCFTCGYDLRATPDRCPECGTAVNAGTDKVK